MLAFTEGPHRKGRQGRAKANARGGSKGCGKSRGKRQSSQKGKASAAAASPPAEPAQSVGEPASAEVMDMVLPSSAADAHRKDWQELGKGCKF